MVTCTTVIAVEVERLLGAQIVHLIHCNYLGSTNYMPGIVLCV